MQFECSEVGNMERFVSQQMNNVRFIPERKAWAQWDGSRWELRGHAAVFGVALKTAKHIYDEARDCPNDEGRKKLTLWACQSQNERRIRAMINMAAKHPKLVASLSDFDREEMHITCTNGVVDLRTQELIGHSPANYVMKRVHVAYKKHARCPVFDAFLDQIFNGDIELISWLQRAIGYTLTGLTNEQVFFLAYGTGANGKSTLFETLLDIIGDYGGATDFENFLSSERGNTRVMESIAKLQGIRFALASETDSARRFSEALVKKITGGDTVTGSFLYGSSFEFRPAFKLWLLANHLPVAKDGSYGFWRRVKVIPFARRFTEEGRDQTLHQKLRQEAEGIFAWCVRGAYNWVKTIENGGGASGLGTCSAVDEATAIYKSDHDLFGQFITDCLVPSPGAELSADELYKCYIRWCDEAGEQYPCSRPIFGSRLQERSIPKKRKSSGNVYLGMTIKETTLDSADF